MKTTVYLSCSKYSTHLSFVKNRLELLLHEKVEFIIFNHFIFCKDSNGEVSKLIDSCNIFIPIIEKEWFESLDLRDELVQAQERRRDVFPIIFEDEIGDNLGKLPFFAKNKGVSINTVKDNRDAAFDSIAQYLQNFANDWNNKVFEEIRKVDDAIKPHKLDKLQNREQEVTHIVLIKANGNKEEIHAKLLDIKEKFTQNNDYKITSIKTLTPIKVSVLDGRFSGKLHMANEFDFILIGTFSNIPNLKAYYEHEKHSEQRQVLYEIINPNVKIHFEEMKKAKDEEIVMATFDKIEQAMKSYFSRLDFIENTPIELPTIH
jgi:hypothetical protein